MAFYFRTMIPRQPWFYESLRSPYGISQYAWYHSQKGINECPNNTFVPVSLLIRKIGRNTRKGFSEIAPSYAMLHDNLLYLLELLLDIKYALFTFPEISLSVHYIYLIFTPRAAKLGTYRLALRTETIL